MTGRGESDTGVIVIGAGVSGLAAATVLAEAGAPVVCLEARDRVGGRTLSTAGWVDLGATWFWDNEPAMAETVASLGLTTYRQSVDGDALVEQPGTGTVRLAGNPIDVAAWRLAGGTQTLARELADRLPDGAIRTSSPATAIEFTSDGPVRVSAGDRTVTGRVLLLAVPPRLAVASIEFAPALPPELVDAASGVRTWMGDMIKAVACFPVPFWRRSGLAGAAFSQTGPFREFHDHSGLQPGQAAIFGFAPAALCHDAPERALARQFVAQLVRLWGPEAAHPSAIHVLDWSRERFTAGRDVAPFPDRAGYGNPVLQAPHLRGRLVFASTETAGAFAGHLEGAILSGRRAAALALELLARGSACHQPTPSRERIGGEE